MRHRLWALILMAACAGQPGAVRSNSPHLLPSEEVNLLRRAAGLGPVRESQGAGRAAQRHAADLARSGGTGHLGSDGSTHADRLRAEGCLRGVENVAWDMGSAGSAFAAWMTSPDHRRNILWPDATAYGLAGVGDRWVLVLAADC